MIGKESAWKMLKRLVRESPADQTEALLLTEDSSLARFIPTGIHQHVAERNRTLILRVVLGKRIAVATTNILHASSLKTLMQKAISLAKIQRANEAFVSLPGPKPIPAMDTFFKNIRRLTPGRKVKIIQDVITRAQ